MHHFLAITSGVIKELKQFRPSYAYSRANSSSISRNSLRQGVESIWMHLTNLQPPYSVIAGMYFMSRLLRMVPEVRAIALFLCSSTAKRKVPIVGTSSMQGAANERSRLICAEGSMMQGEFLSLSEPFSLIIFSSNMDCLLKRNLTLGLCHQCDKQQSLWRSSRITIQVKDINQQFVQNYLLREGQTIWKQTLLDRFSQGSMKQNIKFYNFHFYFKMANKVYTRVELKTLLESTQQEVRSQLLEPLDQKDQLFYENFASISLKALKYAINFLNLINSDQQMGATIDIIFKNLNKSLNDYKGRNIFVHSTFSQESDHRDEDDQIYHFLNTRNNNIPAQCLNNYESERQRNEIEQFLQEMTKHTKTDLRQPKRSLFLPKENTFQLKMGRKATFDTELRCIEEEIVESKTYSQFASPQSEKTFIHAEIKTDFAIRGQDEQNRMKTAEVNVLSQCESIPIFENTLASLSNRKLKPQSSRKKGNSKKKGEKDANKGKKKWKANNSLNCISFRQSMQVLNQHEQQQNQQSKDLKVAHFSIKSVNPFLKITKQLDLAFTKGGFVDKFQIANQNATIFINQQSLTNGKNISYMEQTIQINVEQNLAQNKLFQDNQARQQMQINPFAYDSSVKIKISEVEMAIQCPKVQQSIYKSLEPGPFYKLQAKDNIKYSEQAISAFDQEVARPHNSHTQSIKIATSPMKAIQESQVKQKDIKQYTNSTLQHHPREQQIKNSKKRKIYNSFNNSFQSITNQGQKQNKNYIQNIKKSTFHNVSPSQIVRHAKKQSWRQSNPSSVANKLDASVISSAASQDYLISRQKKPANMKCKLSQIMKNQVRDENMQDKLYESIDGEKRLKAVKANPINNVKLSRQSPLNGKRPAQLEKINMMIFFSSKTKENAIIYQDSPSESDDKVTVTKKQSAQMNILEDIRKIGNIEGCSVDQACKTPQAIQKPGQQLSIIKRYRENQCKTMENPMGSPKRSQFYNKSTQMTPVKASLSSISQRLGHLNSSLSHKKVVHSSSEHQSSESFQFQDLKRKLRNRAYKDKLNQYLELTQTTHLKFCGKDCQHMKELFKGQGRSVPEQILRLFKKLK